MFPTTIYKQADNHTRLVATTIGIDKSDDGYEITTLAVIPKVSTDVNANLEIFSAKGKSVSEALNNIRLCDLNENTRKIYEDALQTIKEG